MNSQDLLNLLLLDKIRIGNSARTATLTSTDTTTDESGNYSQFAGAFAPITSNSEIDAILNPILNNSQQLISNLYEKDTFIENAMRVPVQDALANGFRITSEQLDDTQVADILRFWYQLDLDMTVIDLMTYVRLYGGAALVIETRLDRDDPTEPLDLARIVGAVDIRFYVVSRWKLYTDPSNPDLYIIGGGSDNLNNNVRVHRTRVIKIRGPKPSEQYLSLYNGWGKSACVPIIRVIIEYNEIQQAVLDLVNEAKVDVYRIAGFSNAIASANGRQRIMNTIASSNSIKNRLNALILDSNDSYEQRTHGQFSGLANISREFRNAVAAAVRIPRFKLFGEPPDGFSTGEFDIRLYHETIQSEVRDRMALALERLIQIITAVVVGPRDDVSFEWNPVAPPIQAEIDRRNTVALDNIQKAIDIGVFNRQMAAEEINKREIFLTEAVDLTEEIEARRPVFPTPAPEETNEEEEDDNVTNKRRPKKVLWRNK